VPSSTDEPQRPLPAGIYQKIDSMSPAELDELPFGSIQLSETGEVLQFNAYEGQLASLLPTDVIGKNFFRDVAPCADVKEFAGLFRSGVLARSLHTKFRYHFAFKQRPRNVLVTLFYSPSTSTVWVLIQPQD